MDGLLVRLYLVGNIVVPLLFFMASVYLALHVAFARFITSPRSPFLWFFSIVTGPLIRPVRSVLPTGTSEPRVRVAALVMYLVLWLASRAFFIWLGAALAG
jgi:hypothetical protein